VAHRGRGIRAPTPQFALKATTARASHERKTEENRNGIQARAAQGERSSSRRPASMSTLENLTMWKHDKAVNSTSEPSTAQSQPGRAASPQVSKQQIEREVVNIGKSVIIKGELSSREDLTIDGQVEGKIELKDHTLTIGSTGKTKAEVFAKTVIVMGAINGNIAASEKVDIRAGGVVEGDILAPRVAIAEGACFRGSIDMQRKSEQQG
jgi:cytoskeletal protein CcmA (bactofilin family)